jgi:hypothetical protein
MSTETQPSTVEELEQDCRLERRIIWFKPLDIVPCKTLKTWAVRSVRMVDASTSGVGLIGNEPMNPGEQFFLKAGGGPMLMYEVRHCTATMSESYQIGAQFLAVVAARHEEDRESILRTILLE